MEEVIPALGAGIISTIICNPLDTLRINYQLKNNIQFKLKYLYRGISYGIIAVPSFWTIYFPFYKKLKDTDLPKPVASYVSCCTASTFTTPFWVLRQKLQTGKTLENMNFYNYYRGLFPTYIINLTFTIQVPLYEYLKDRSNNSTFNTFLNTAISKTIASCVFYPIDTIRAKLRNSDPIRNIKIIDYYRGINIYLLRSIPYHATVFCSFEFIKNLM
tara:strand:+ start:21 stop:668 length:648 start_codon:yes stop_codon:yes gene_type:complete